MSARFLLALIFNQPYFYSAHFSRLSFSLGLALVLGAILISIAMLLTWGANTLFFAKLALGLAMIGLVLLYHTAVDTPSDGQY